MNQLVLWLNMISFALMTAAVGLLYLVHARTPRAWLLALIIYTASYAAWLLFGTYAYVQAVFLSAELPALAETFAYVRLAVSFVVLGAGSTFYLGIAVTPWRPRAHLVTAAGALAVAIPIALYFAAGLSLAGRLGTLLFNSYLCVLSLLALRKARAARGAQRRVIPFLVYSFAAYAVLSALTIVLTLLPPASYGGIPLNVLATGVFTFIWGALMLTIAMRWITVGAKGDRRDLPATFVLDHGISVREREIVEAARDGSSSREIGEKLFISQRTVEAHLHNVYRKCGVTNRVELLNLVSRYGSPSENT